MRASFLLLSQDADPILSATLSLLPCPWVLFTLSLLGYHGHCFQNPGVSLLYSLMQLLTLYSLILLFISWCIASASQPSWCVSIYYISCLPLIPLFLEPLKLVINTTCMLSSFAIIPLMLMHYLSFSFRLSGSFLHFPFIIFLSLS